MNTLRDNFDAKSLPQAVAELFRMNNYTVRESVHVHGAEVDLVASAIGDPYPRPIYIEATIEYVNNVKWGKDSTKFLLIKAKDPGATCLCISSTGFTPDVAERAQASGVEISTYDELFRRFEKFSHYLDGIESNQAEKKLLSSYEEPFFSDGIGKHKATDWLSLWKGYKNDSTRWLIILGEYGTGKTALTQVLQHRWAEEYKINPSKPIPLRIELRNFTRQFDARGLLHHFLDTNKLSHVPIEFMEHCIRTGRAILLLDGYDEMAQFLNARERRSCLSALAELASHGAKGILTSRPNYFTENEELNVFDALYRSIEQGKLFLSKGERLVVAEEQAVDDLVDRYILNRYERILQDLTPEQTRALVVRKLGKDVSGQTVVLSLLDKIFRQEVAGPKQALSGKPVIISYLLELVDDLRERASGLQIDSITEWQIYKLIVDRLMFRDHQRTPTILPDQRRKSLHILARRLSTKDGSIATEETFYDIIDALFSQELKRLTTEERLSRRGQLFMDLRSSTTLTRAAGGGLDGWAFSHNSLREYLVAESLIWDLSNHESASAAFPISDAMRAFAASLPTEDLQKLWIALGEIWPQRINGMKLGPYVSLLWEAAKRSEAGLLTVLNGFQRGDSQSSVSLGHLEVRGISFPPGNLHEIRVDASNSNIADSDFSDCNLRGSDFSSSILDNVSFMDCDLTACDMTGSFIFDCDLTGACLADADFRGVDPDIAITVRHDADIPTFYEGKDAIGYVAFHGGKTDPVEAINIYRHHSKYPIVAKILEKLSEQQNRQLRGLTQRGEARVDPPFARALVDQFIAWGWVEIGRNDLVSVSAKGRSIVQRLVLEAEMPSVLADFLESRRA